MELRLSWLRFLVALAFAGAALIKCDEVQRIYQSRISVINSGQVSVDTFEVVGLASVELGADLSGASPPTYVFDCNTTLNNGTNITWRFNSEAPRFGIGPIPNTQNGRRLSTSGIMASDLGVYTCLDTYTSTNVSINITQDNPAILPVNRVLRIMEGTAATLQVYVSGYPLVTSDQIHWYRPNGTEILEGHATFQDGRKTMVLSELQSTDGGLYRCEIITSYGDRSTLIQLDVYGQSPLRVYLGRIFGSPVEVEVFPVQGLATVELVTNGPTYYLDCNTSRNDGSGIMWQKVDGENRFLVSDVASSASKRLSLARLAESDLGLYECFDNQSGAGDRAIVNITTDNPAVSAINQTVEVLVGGQALLEVYASGYPLISSDNISWYWPNGSIIQENEAEFMNDGRTLFLVNIQLMDAGAYRCEVTLPGTGGSRSALIQLSIHTHSLILSHPSPIVRALEWNDVMLSCSAGGVPPPNITWEKEGGATPPTTTEVTTLLSGTTVTSELTFSGIQYSDAGRYRCVADNGKTPPVSSNYAQIRVTPRLILRINISGEPHPFQESITVPEGADVAIECFGSGDLQWTASNRLEIPVIRDAEPDSSSIYQVYISSRDAQLLQIRNFSRSRTAAGYTCRTDLTIQRGARVEITVTLHGDEITEDTRTEPMRDSESVAAIIGGIVVVIILAVMLVLFAAVILLILIKRRAKYIIQISAMQASEEAQRSNGNLSMSSSLKEKPEFSDESVHEETKVSEGTEGSIHTSTEESVEKQEQNDYTGTGQFNEVL